MCFRRFAQSILPCIVWIVAAVFTAVCAYGQTRPKGDGDALNSWVLLGNLPAQKIQHADVLSVQVPENGDTFVAANQDTLTWVHHVFPTSIIDLKRFLRASNQVYAFSTLESAETQQIPFRFGSTGPAYIWVNGELVFSHDESREYQHSEDTFYATLNAGSNNILVFVSGWVGDWKFSLSHPNVIDNSVSGRAFLADGKPAEGAEILLLCNNEVSAQTFAGQNGIYSIEAPLDTDRCSIKATLDNLGMWRVFPKPGARGIRGFELRLKPAATLGGRVYLMDGKAPNAGVFIEAIRKEDQMLIGSAFSDEQGFFTLPNLPSGQYKLRLSTPWGFEYVDAGTPYFVGGTLQVAAGQQPVSNIEIRFPETRKGVWHSIGPLDGLPYHIVNDVLIDATGQLACATSGGGVCQFNGHSFVNYAVRSGLASNLAKLLMEASDSSLWIGTDSGLARLKDGLIHPVAIADETLGNDITALFEDSSGRIWIGTSLGIFQVVNDKFSALDTIQEQLPNVHVTTITEDAEGKIWIGTLGGLGYIEGDAINNYRQFEGRAIYDLHADRKGGIWLATNKGIATFDGVSTTELTTKNGLVDNAVREICESSDGLMWFATLGGLSAYNGAQFTNYTTRQGLANNKVTSVDCSQDKTVWIGTENGISSFDYAIRAFDESDGLFKPGGGVVNVFDIVHASTSDQMYIATAWGGIFAFNGYEFNRILKDEGDLYVRQMLEISPNKYVFGTHEGLRSYAPDSAVHDPVTFNYKEWNIALAQDDDGFLWTGKGFTGGGLSKYDVHTGERIAHYTLEDGLSDEQVWALYDTPQGLWVGTSAGIVLFEEGVFRDVHQELGLENSGIYNIYEDRAGNLWFAGSNGVYHREADKLTHYTSEGVFELEAGSWQLVTDRLKLPDNSVWAVYQTDDDKMWFGTQSRGVIAYDGIAYSKIDARDGLAGGHVMKINADASGMLWIATFDGGLTGYERINKAHSVTIDAISSGSSSYLAKDELPAFDVDRTISVAFSETDLSTQIENRQFRILVKNGTGDLVTQVITKERVFNWTPADAGNYHLEVQYIDQNLNYSTARSVSLDIHLPLLKNAYFLLFAALMLCMLIGYSYHLRRKYLLQKNEARELEKKMLATEIEAKDQLINFNNELLETNKKLEGRTDSLREAIEKNKELLGIAAHDLKNPLGGIIGLADMILEDMEAGIQATYESAVEHVPLLKEEAERMLLITKKLLDSQHHDEQVQLNKEMVLLGDIVAAVIRWNDVQAKSKNITLHYGTCANIIVEVDEIAIQRVLDNYVSNAVKYSPIGTNVYIDICAAQQGGETLGSPTVKVSVKDEGPGLTPADKLKVFGKMQRLSAKPTAGEHSTGLGLFIVKSLIEAHSGEVGVDSEAGQGASFWFTLPCVTIGRFEEQMLPAPRIPTMEKV
ncbi:MAG: two-component regulator propeller domain-containing protein [Bacteroidota bacterium]